MTTAKSTIKKGYNKHRKRISDRAVAVILITPPLLFMLAYTLYPILRIIWMSLHEISITEPWLGEPFVGIDNYLKMLNDSEFWYTLKFTIAFALVTGFFELVFGLLLAVVANKKFKYRGLVRGALLFPWVLPTVLSAMTWRWMYNYDYGLFNGLLLKWGLIDNPINWLGNEKLAIAAVFITAIWKNASFMAIILLAGLQSIPEELYESAVIDGANKIKSFFLITLPMLRNVILVAIVLRTITTLQAYDLIVGLTDGGPGNATESLPLYIYNTTFIDMNWGYGSALGVVLSVIILIITVTFIKILYKPTD